jgi:spermidine/putrescine transport system substrate-binding protein
MDAAVLEAALILKIENPFSMSDADLERVRVKLVEQIPLLRYYWNSQSDIEQSLASGEIVAAYAWNDAYASLKRQGLDVEYMNPREGLMTWVDSQVIIKDGPGSDKERYDYLNATLTPEAGKFMIEEYGYGSSNQRAFDIADQELLATFGYSDPSNLISNSVLFDAFEPALRDKANVMFEEIKAGY